MKTMLLAVLCFFLGAQSLVASMDLVSEAKPMLKQTKEKIA